MQCSEGGSEEITAPRCDPTNGAANELEAAVGITLPHGLVERCGHSKDSGGDLTASSGITPMVAGECFDGGDRPPSLGSQERIATARKVVGISLPHLRCCLQSSVPASWSLTSPLFGSVQALARGWASQVNTAVWDVRR